MLLMLMMLMIKKRPLIFRPALNSHEHDREVLGGVDLDILGLARGGAKRLAPVSTASMACDYWLLGTATTRHWSVAHEPRIFGATDGEVKV